MVTSKLASQIETITPEKAKQLLSTNQNNRPISQDNIDFICTAITSGKFALNGESIKISKTGVMLDGQHRCLAVIKTNMPIITYVTRGMEDDTFKYMDTGRGRQASDVLATQHYKNPKTLAAMVKFIINFNNGYYNRAATATISHKLRMTNDDVLAFVNENIDSLEESYPFGHTSTNKLINATALASLHYIFKTKSRSQADEFCERAADGSNISKESPIYQLRQRYIADSKNKLKMSHFEKVQLVCKAWNLFRKKRSVKSLQINLAKEGFPTPI
jgi:hypothetical protein